MKTHLKKAAERFHKKLEKEYLIHPISTIDTEIIVELKEVFKKLEKGELVKILDGWKYNKDETVRDDLLQWNIDFQKPSSDNLPEGVSGAASIFEYKPDVYIKIYDEVINLSKIDHYNKIEEWDDKNNKPMYGIIFNETPTDAVHRTYLPNKKVFFINDEERNLHYDNIDFHFGGQDNVDFV